MKLKNQTANRQEGLYFWPSKYVNFPTFIKLGIIFQKTLDSKVHFVIALKLTSDFQVLFRDWYLKKLQLCFFICHLFISKIPYDDFKFISGFVLNPDGGDYKWRGFEAWEIS